MAAPSLPQLPSHIVRLHRRLPTPVVYLEATLAHKKEVKRMFATPSLFDDDPPPGELRAVKVIPNKAAQQDGFTIPTNMRVPVASIIHRLFDAERNPVAMAKNA